MIFGDYAVEEGFSMFRWKLGMGKPKLQAGNILWSLMITILDATGVSEYAYLL